MYLFIFNYPLQYTKRLLTWLQGQRQFRYVVWIINWALQMHCNARVPLASNKLVSQDLTKTDHRVLHKIYVIWYSFWILGTSFARLFEIKQFHFPWSCFFLIEKLFIFHSKQWKMIESEENFLKGTPPFWVFWSIL